MQRLSLIHIYAFPFAHDEARRDFVRNIIRVE